MSAPRFVCFRYFIVPLEEHLFMQPASQAERIRWFKEALLETGEFKSNSGIDHALFIGNRTSQHVFGKLCRKRVIELHQKGAKELTEVTQEDWQPLDFVCDLDPAQQLLVIRYNSSIIQKVETIGRLLAHYASPGMFVHGYGVSFHPIVSRASFWELVGSSSSVFRVTFNLESPNLFGAGSNANKSLRLLREHFNNSSTSVTLKNDGGDLRLPQEELETYQDYADRGGGSWELVVGRGNRRKHKIKSSERATKVTVEAKTSDSVETLLLRALHQFLDLL